MASMSTEIAVLRALLRLSRRRAANGSTLEALVTLVREDAPAVQRALASLARAQLVLRSGETARLSMAGLAVAAAAQAKANAKRPRSITSGRASASVFPLVRRHRAA